MKPKTSSYCDAMVAPGRAPEIPPEDDIYGWLVGSWEQELTAHDPDGSVRRTAGEAHFSWGLEGRPSWTSGSTRAAKTGPPCPPASPIGMARPCVCMTHPCAPGASPGAILPRRLHGPDRAPRRPGHRARRQRSRRRHVSVDLQGNHRRLLPLDRRDPASQPHDLDPSGGYTLTPHPDIPRLR